ncbi:hypothetical protein B0H14DRAFT_3130459 [Mycena olivaceomarginata]|nr:hypothetical protein B0H14DRAFT_3130459 [Mycena olivaceomarginata]
MMIAKFEVVGQSLTNNFKLGSRPWLMYGPAAQAPGLLQLDLSSAADYRHPQGASHPTQQLNLRALTSCIEFYKAAEALLTGTDETVVAQSYPIGAASKTDLLAMLNVARRECETRLAVSCRPTYQNSSWIPPLTDDKNQGGGPLSREETLSPVSSESFAAERVLPDNEFMWLLAKRWQEPPLSHYNLVSEKAVAVLHRLSLWPSPLPPPSDVSRPRL